MNPMAQNPDDLIDDGDSKRGRMEELEMRVEELEGALKVAEARVKELEKFLQANRWQLGRFANAHLEAILTDAKAFHVPLTL